MTGDQSVPTGNNWWT